ncbi:hypothetical protein [Pseudovibrio sp. SPO723]|nr:hypothetical protein [Pseudovibrio sp. SPO723]MDD7909152.1 hypothetical protein [Pseudovibrio exalbescens]MDX5595596.1 hypothetical protein [Pseudovibrio sp. SPO723]
MKSLFMNKFVSGGVVLVVFQVLAYLALQGEMVASTGSRRKAVADAVNFLVERFGAVPAAAIFSVTGIVIALIIYKVLERRAAAS